MWKKNPKKLYNAICRIKMNYGCQLYNTASPGKLKKLDSIHREGIKIYKGAFRTSPVEVLHVETNSPSLEIRKKYWDLDYCIN